jgi:hypothetical protein
MSTSAVSLADNIAMATEEKATKREDSGASTNFSFIPVELAAKCRSLVESFHGMYGYIGLPDMLWLSDAREIIECDDDLAQMFRNASRSRGAKRANESFLIIATAIVSAEVLARDFAGWGKRFPAAKREADKLLAGFPQRRAWLMDLYLYPPLGSRRAFADALEPLGTGAPAKPPQT